MITKTQLINWIREARTRAGKKPLAESSVRKYAEMFNSINRRSNIDFIHHIPSFMMIINAINTKSRGGQQQSNEQITSRLRKYIDVVQAIPEDDETRQRDTDSLVNDLSRYMSQVVARKGRRNTDTDDLPAFRWNMLADQSLRLIAINNYSANVVGIIMWITYHDIGAPFRLQEWYNLTHIQALDTGSYLNMRTGELTITDHKTVGNRGVKTMMLSRKSLQYILLLRRRWQIGNSPWVFPKVDAEKDSFVQMTDTYLSKIIKKWVGVSNTMLRRIFVSDVYPNLSREEQDEANEIMGHSASTADRHYGRYRDSIHPPTQQLRSEALRQNIRTTSTDDEEEEEDY